MGQACTIPVHGSCTGRQEGGAMGGAGAAGGAGALVGAGAAGVDGVDRGGRYMGFLPL